ncbi:MAG TPA: CDP-glucose 4,6-dehydratase [Pyrinomonadaceae bacterium]|nr:CDP-glucose 4,6-dehydratase [Pyrinomonadaceae bacterium]
MRPEFWRDKRVLVTGHTGFKGSWLSLWLAEMGARVTGYALEPPTTPSLFQLARIAERVESLNGDVRDFDRLSRVVAEQRPEVVIHMAAQSLVRRSYVDPVETYGTNVMGTVNVLEAARRTGADFVKVLLVVTSDKCYENREWVWGYRETDPMGGHDPYSSSKGCAELITSAMRNSFFQSKTGAKGVAAVASARAGNVLGGGDWAEDRLVPDIIKSWLEGMEVAIRSPRAVRPWQHVLDPLHGYLLLCEKLYEEGAAHAGGWNFGPREEDARTVEHVVGRLSEMWASGDGKAAWALDKNEHPHEAHYLKLDCSKARTHLHWRPLWNLERTLKETVNWYRAYAGGEDMQRFSLEQIRAFHNSEAEGEGL